jgi:hypothetical protein
VSPCSCRAIQVVVVPSRYVEGIRLEETGRDRVGLEEFPLDGKEHDGATAVSQLVIGLVGTLRDWQGRMGWAVWPE